MNNTNIPNIPKKTKTKRRLLKEVSTGKEFFADEEIPVNTCKKNKDFAMFAYQNEEKLIMNKELRGITFLVLKYMTWHFNYKNQLKIKQKDLAIKLDITAEHISKSIKKLIQHNAVIKLKNNKTKNYMLNPEYYWKGDKRNELKKIYEEEKNKQKLTLKEKNKRSIENYNTMNVINLEKYKNYKR